MRTVTVFERPGCCLCDDAVEIIKRVQARTPFTLQRRDIESDEELFKAYLERIPVVVIDGGVTFELFVDEIAFERSLH